MMRRVAFAIAVLAATLYWANCVYHPPQPPDPAFNTFFAGCFKGAVTDPSGFGDVTVILEARTEDKFMLGGCVRLAPPIGSAVTGTLAGMVLDERQEARVTVTPTSGEPPFTLLVHRSPDGDVVATTVNLTDAGGAPFTSANNLPACVPVLTCASLSISMPFVSGGGAQ
jgi:hypothetical protein